MILISNFTTLSAINKKVTSHKKKKHRNHNESVRTRNDFVLFLLTSYFLLIERANYMIPAKGLMFKKEKTRFIFLW